MGRLFEIIFDLLIFFVMVKVLGRVFRLFGGAEAPKVEFRTHWGHAPRATSQGRSELTGQTARDPVCGMFVSTEVSHKLQVNGKTLHFCSEECLNQYQGHPTLV
jgi:YHS domain-containing protein